MTGDPELIAWLLVRPEDANELDYITAAERRRSAQEYQERR